jgi:hypothetical protein
MEKSSIIRVYLAKWSHKVPFLQRHFKDIFFKKKKTFIPNYKSCNPHLQAKTPMRIFITLYIK